MIKILPDLPLNVFGYEIIGELGPEDYEKLRVPLRKYSSGLQRGMNLLVDVTRAGGLSTRAFWETAKTEWEAAGNIQRVAVIGSPLWTQPLLKISEMLCVADKVHVFDVNQHDRAVAWLAGMVSYQ